MKSSTTKTLYALLGVGFVLAFLGHGMLGLKGSDTFIDLVIGNYDKVLGGTMSTDAATTIVNVIGIVDIAIAAIFLGLVVAALCDHPAAYSPLAMGVLAWGVAWGFLTALSRFTAVMNGAEIWDVIERGPNFMLPAALLYIIYRVRQERAPAVARRARVELGERGSAAAPAR